LLATTDDETLDPRDTEEIAGARWRRWDGSCSTILRP
jgi:hypothetical protein